MPSRFGPEHVSGGRSRYWGSPLSFGVEGEAQGPSSNTYYSSQCWCYFSSGTSWRNRKACYSKRLCCSDRGVEVLQLVLSAVLRSEVLTQLHQDHGHQGTCWYDKGATGQECCLTWPVGYRSASSVSRQRRLHQLPGVIWGIYWPLAQMR